GCCGQDRIVGYGAGPEPGHHASGALAPTQRNTGVLKIRYGRAAGPRSPGHPNPRMSRQRIAQHQGHGIGGHRQRSG
ncbi:hypothetical protein ABTA52_20760, partial [Acinetobacter baumannii]